LGKKILRSLIIALLITGIAVILIGCSIALPTFDASKLNIEYKNTEIYDRNDKPILKYQATPGEPAKLSEIPDQLQKALVDIEDNRFFDHKGIDFRAIGRALWRDIITRSAAEGGSTLTQQLAKNVYLTQERTLERKVKEIYLAAQIERNFSKEEILEKYFNVVYFGHGAYGIKMAAEVYFDKGDRMQDLTLAESALLAGLPNAPSAYDPYINEKLAVERRNQVLAAMEKAGHITAEQRRAAEQEKVTLKRGTDIKGMDSTEFPYYLDYVLEEAEEKLGIPAEQILRGGVKVYTYLDTNMQKTLENLYKDPKNFPKNAADGTWVQAASVVVEHKTGGIVALVGGRDKDGNHVFRGLNRVSNSKLPPGSTFKPIIDYAPAIDLGLINTTTPLPNKQVTFPGGYAPKNWNGKYSDTIPANVAFAMSLNVPAVHLLYDKVKIDRGFKYATENFGIPLDSEYKNKLGIALGAGEVRPLDLAGAYTAFANGGVRTNPHAIRKIVNEAGSVIGQIKTETHQAISENTAKLMTKLMKEVVEQGTGTAARVSGREVAGKSGTHEMPTVPGANTNTWFAGYTAEYVMVNYMGFDQTDSQHLLWQGSEIPAALFSKFMTQALKGVPPKPLDSGGQEKMIEEEKDNEKDQDKEKNAIVRDLKAQVQADGVRLQWSPVDLKDVKYLLYRAEKLSNGTAVNPEGLADVTNTTFLDTRVEPGKTYLYTLVVWKEKELSKSNIVELTVPGKGPNTPTDPKQPGGNENGTGNQQGGTSNPTTPTVPNTDGGPTKPTTPTPPPVDPNKPTTGGTTTGTGGTPGTGGGGTGTGTGTGNGAGTGSGGTGGTTAP
jgi:penicillin-binding protein 2A